VESTPDADGESGFAWSGGLSAGGSSSRFGGVDILFAAIRELISRWKTPESLGAVALGEGLRRVNANRILEMMKKSSKTVRGLPK